MIYIKLLLGFTFLIGLCLAQDEKINVHVYYESKCYFSRSFIINQIDRALEKLSGLVNFIMVPFGYANVKRTILSFKDIILSLTFAVKSML